MSYNYTSGGRGTGSEIVVQKLRVNGIWDVMAERTVTVLLEPEECESAPIWHLMFSTPGVMSQVRCWYRVI
jgi:hypothetical protein